MRSLQTFGASTLTAVILMLVYLVTYKQAVAKSRNSLLMQWLGMDICMWINKRIIFGIYGIVGSTLAAQAKAKVEYLAKNPPSPTAICFIGSSTFTYWQHLQQDMKPHQVYNAAFGGSRTSDLFPWLDGLVFNFTPKQIVYYCGINDIGSGGTAEEAFQGFAKFFQLVKQRLPDSEITYVSMIISPYHQFAGNGAEIARGNALVFELCKQNAIKYIDGNQGAILQNRDLYINDGLHLNDQGHRELAKMTLPHI